MWTVTCKWRGKDFNGKMSKTSTVKELKQELCKTYNVEMSSLKLIIKGSSKIADTTKLADISGASTPLAVSILSAQVIGVNLEELEKRNYQKQVEAIQEGLKNAEESAAIRSVNLSYKDALIPAHLQSAISSTDSAMKEMQNPFSNLPKGTFETQMQIFSSAFLPSGRPPAEDSNQVILPTSVLKYLTDQQVEFPIFLELTRTSRSGEKFTVFVTPGSYEQKIDAIYAPYQLLVDLGLFSNDIEHSMDIDTPQSSTSSASGSLPPTTPKTSPYPEHGEGSLVNVKYVKLPHGISATLQPQEFDWITAVPEDQQKAVLEERLRKYQCLALNQTITISHLDHRFQFKVVDLNPESGASLLEAELAVAILPPIHAPHHIDLTHNIRQSGKEDATVEVQHVVNLKKGEASYFTAELSDPSQAVLLELDPIEGFPASIYACTRRRYPTPADHIWSSDDTTGMSSSLIRKLTQTGRKRLLLSQDDPSFTMGSLYIGVHATYADSSAIFKITKGLKSVLSVGNLTTGELLSSSDNTTNPPNSTKCDNCSRWIPNATFVIHTAQCSKRNWKCPQCQFVCPIAEKSKHLSITHSVIKCECGFESEGELVALHKQFECEFRPFTCPFCNLTVPYKSKSSHIRDCGTRTTQCPVCSEWVQNSELQLHHSKFHDSDEDYSSYVHSMDGSR